MKSLFRSVDCQNDSCPLHQSRQFVPCEVVRRNDEPLHIMFVGGAVGREDSDQPFSGSAGQLLRGVVNHAIRQTGLDINYALSNVVRCAPRDSAQTARDAIGPSNIDYCKRFAASDISDESPQLIVLLGVTPIETLTSINGGITELRGRFYDVPIGGERRRVFATFHPAYVVGNPGLVSVFRSDIERAIQEVTLGVGRFRSYTERGRSRLLTRVDEVEDYIYRQLGQETTEKTLVAVDIEGPNLNKRYGNQIGMLQFATDADSATCIPFQHPQTPFDAAELRRVRRALIWLFETRDLPFRAWIAHGGKFEQQQIGNLLLDGRRIRAKPMLDTQAGAYLLDENRIGLGRGALGLKGLAREWLGFEHYRQEDLDARAREGGLMRLPLEQLADYGGMDAYVTWRLFRVQAARARAQNYLQEWLGMLEFVFSPIYRFLSRMESTGIYVDLPTVRQLMRHDSALYGRIKELDAEWRRNHNVIEANRLAVQAELARRTNGKRGMTGRGRIVPAFKMPWVVTPNKNLGFLFVDRLGLDATIGDNGRPSINAAFLEQHKDLPESQLVTELRQLEKLAGTYLEAMHRYLDPSFGAIDYCTDSRLRPSYHFTSTVSGRGSAEAPSVQNIPTRKGKFSKVIKNLIRADQQHDAPRLQALVQADAMGAEVKVWAMLSRDPVLIKIFNDGHRYRQEYARDPTPERRVLAETYGDPHKMTASIVFGVPPEAVEKEQRQTAKAIILGKMYGRGTRALARQIGITDEEAAEIEEKIMGRFRVGVRWLEDQAAHARKHHYVEAPHGRRRHLDAYFIDDEYLHAEADRQAKNSPIQAASSDFTLLSAALFADWVEEKQKPWLVVNSVHDSMIMQVAVDDVPELIRVHSTICTTGLERYYERHWGYRLPCPIELEYEVSVGPEHGWGRLEKWDRTKAGMERLLRLARCGTTEEADAILGEKS